jgi:hypothetical protein
MDWKAIGDLLPAAKLALELLLNSFFNPVRGKLHHIPGDCNVLLLGDVTG